MFDALHNRWSWKQVLSAIAIVLVVCLTLGVQLLFNATPGDVTTGVVLSSSTAELARVRGGTHGAVSIQLPSGQTVQALVISGGAPLPGARVRVLDRTTLFGAHYYEVIATIP